MIFARRGRSGPDPHLEWKIRLFFIGAAVAFLGVALESNLLVGGAIAVLLLGVGLRFLPVRSHGEDSGEGEEGQGLGPKEDFEAPEGLEGEPPS